MMPQALGSTPLMMPQSSLEVVCWPLDTGGQEALLLTLVHLESLRRRRSRHPLESFTNEGCVSAVFVFFNVYYVTIIFLATCLELPFAFFAYMQERLDWYQHNRLCGQVSPPSLKM